MSLISFSHLLFFNLLLSAFSISIPDKGKWDFKLNNDNHELSIPRTLYKGTQLFIRISCDEEDTEKGEAKIQVSWIIKEFQCWEDFLNLEDGAFRQLQLKEIEKNPGNSSIRASYERKCDDNVVLEEVRFTPPSVVEDKNGKEGIQSISPVAPDKLTLKKPHTENNKHLVFTFTKDGIYLVWLDITPKDNKEFQAAVHIEMKGSFGYLSAVEWPLLPFYGTMCVVYVIFAFIWLTVSFLQWRDLLRIQFWIGAVILIGMIEKAMFYEEYHSINSTGESSLLGTVFAAELISSGKRTLARVLVIIVSLGYGIVKPRLGSHLPKVVGTGIAYFILASTEAYLRVMRPKSESLNTLLVASILLALLDSFICWWIFASLVQTTRTLRLRRNLVKLTLYNHFTNTLIFSVGASSIFMLYSIKTHRIIMCLTDWKELWIDDAYWHLQFSVILLVIMVLWRPTNNNQRYAFSPLLDAADDDDDDEEVEHFVNDAYGVKMRGMTNSRSDSPKPRSSENMDEDLKWVEDNIPPCLIDSTFPILDSDEEIMNTKFEISKME